MHAKLEGVERVLGVLTKKRQRRLVYLFRKQLEYPLGLYLERDQLRPHAVLISLRRISSRPRSSFCIAGGMPLEAFRISSARWKSPRRSSAPTSRTASSGPCGVSTTAHTASSLTRRAASTARR